MKFSQHSWHKRWQYSKVKENKCWIARISRYNTKHEQVCVERKAIEWSMITQIIEGKDGISHHEFNWYPWGAWNVDDDHDTFVERIHEEAIDQRLHQAKGLMQQKIIGATDTTQTRGQVCCSRWNDMTRKIDVSLAHRRKWCSGNKDQVAQLKSSR